MKNINYRELKIQKYLQCQELSIRQKKLIFRARTGMLPVGFNYGKKNPCPLCKISDDTDIHLIYCPILKMSCNDLIENIDIKYEDIYSTKVTKLSKISKLLLSALRTREELLSI